MSDEVRAYRLKHGDEFVIDSRQFIEVFSKSNLSHVFIPLAVFKKPIWYKPKTWFRKYIKILYVEHE